MMNLFFWIAFLAITALLIYNKWFRDVEFKRERVVLTSAQAMIKKDIQCVSTVVPQEIQEPMFSFYTIQPEIQAVSLSRIAKKSLDLIPITQNADTENTILVLQQVA